MKKPFYLGAACILLLTPAFAACSSEEKLQTEEVYIEQPQETLPLFPQEEEAASPSEPTAAPAETEPTAPPTTTTTTPITTTTPTTTTVKPQEQEAEQCYVQYVLTATQNLNIRTGAGTTYRAVDTLQQNTLYAYVAKTGDWYKTYYKNQPAYVSANASYTKLIKMEKGSDKVEKVIEEGSKLLGVPYVYGAVRYHDGAGNKLKNFTTSEFDCSSLMQYIFYKGAGKLLNVTTRTQVSQGTAVEKKNIKRGDLLFFTNASRKNNTGIERVGHVALYLGDNYILHTASDFAKIEQISSARWGYYITARRII